jgi:hypothetical protein
MELFNLIFSVMASMAGNKSYDRTGKAADEKVTVIDKKIEELKPLKTLLKDSAENCKKGFR